MCLFCEADTDRAVGLLRQYQANLTGPEEQMLKTSVAKVSAILGSQLFKALLGKRNTVRPDWPDDTDSKENMHATSH